MSAMQEKIEQKLESTFQPSFIEVQDESHMHSVPENAQTHFKVVLVSDVFEGRRLVQRHQAIYGALSEEMAGSVHALALHVYSDSEWQARQKSAPSSPNCLGGSKAE